jgi:AcrR family transcriptional regulator
MGAGVTRPSDITRERILKAAQRLFADRGYEETSVRAIVAKARVNQAAINYHFGGKDGLYREVLRAAFRALTEHQLSHAQETKSMSREDALAEFIRHQLHPLAARDELSRHFRIFNWEAVRPTTVYRKLLSEEATPFLGQCSIFIRNRDQLANPPVSLDLDERAVEQLTTLVSGWALSGLGKGSGAAQSFRAVKEPQARGATFALGATEAGGP